MSKTNVRRPQKKTTLKKRQDWDVSEKQSRGSVFSSIWFLFQSSIGDLSQHRLSDDETVKKTRPFFFSSFQHQFKTFRIDENKRINREIWR